MITVSKDVLVEAVEAAGLDEEAIYEDYSGRGMYGAVCLGFTVEDASEVAAVALALERAGESEAADALSRGGSQDSMGMRTIVYFRGVQVEEE